MSGDWSSDVCSSDLIEKASEASFVVFKSCNAIKSSFLEKTVLMSSIYDRERSERSRKRAKRALLFSNHAMQSNHEYDIMNLHQNIQIRISNVIN